LGRRWCWDAGGLGGAHQVLRANSGTNLAQKIFW
jgi:hypothetical protein